VTRATGTAETREHAQPFNSFKRPPAHNGNRIHVPCRAPSSIHACSGRQNPEDAGVRQRSRALTGGSERMPGGDGCDARLFMRRGVGFQVRPAAMQACRCQHSKSRQLGGSFGAVRPDPGLPRTTADNYSRASWGGIVNNVINACSDPRPDRSSRESARTAVVVSVGDANGAVGNVRTRHRFPGVSYERR
jgi:hypothetical protein